MGDNLQWILGAFGAGWVIHMLYLLSLSHRQRKVISQLDDLRRLLSSQESESRHY